MISFDQRKATEATAALLRNADGQRMNYMRLLKLLYLAERKSLEVRGRPIFCDTVVAMKRGPVLSRVYDLIKGSDPGVPQWAQFFKKEAFDIVMKSDPGVARLSRAEVDIINEIDQQFSECDETDIVDWCHDNLPEFQKNDPEASGKKQNRIPLEDIMEAIGRPGQHDAVLEQLKESMAAADFFRSHDVE